MTLDWILFASTLLAAFIIGVLYGQWRERCRYLLRGAVLNSMGQHLGFARKRWESDRRYRKRLAEATRLQPPPVLRLSDGLRDRIVELVRDGMPLDTARAAAGLSRNTLRIWLERATRDRRDGKATRFTEFQDAITAAEVERLDT